MTVADPVVAVMIAGRPAQRRSFVKAIKLGMATLIGLGCVLLGGSPVSAEWFGDVYVGPSFIQSHDVRVDDRAAGRGTFVDVGFDTGLSWGGRFGGYFEGLPFLGVAVNLLNFSADISRQSVQLQGCFAVGGCGSGPGGTGSFDVRSTAVSVDLMLRLPLIKTADAPQGLVQPYIAVGVPLFVTTVTPRNTTVFRNHQSDTNVSVGYAAAGGIAFHVYKNLAVFGEYRFNHVRVDADLESSVTAGKATFRTDLNSHSTLIGISARW